MFILFFYIVLFCASLSLMYWQITKLWAFSGIIVSGFIVLSSAGLLMLSEKEGRS